jgi:hypothetical protein
MFAIGQDPPPTVPGIRAVATLMFCEPLIQMQRRANIKSPVDWLFRMYVAGISGNMVGTRRLELLTFPARRDARYLLLFEIW